MTPAEFRSRSSFTFEELLAASAGRLVEGESAPLLPRSLLMPFHEITELSWDEAKGAGRLVAQRKNRVNDWFYDCHFLNDPVMPGCWGVDALWRALAFFAAWRGLPAVSRPLDMQDLSFFGQIRPYDASVTYELEVAGPESEGGETALAASGKVKVDGCPIYSVGRLRAATCFGDVDEAGPESPPALAAEEPAPFARSLSPEEYGRRTAFSLPELIAHARGTLIQANGAEKIHIPAALMAGLERVHRLSWDESTGEGEMVASRENSPLDWFYPMNHEEAPPAFLIDIVWQALGFFLSWRQHPGTGRALGFESARVFDRVLPSDKRIVCRAKVRRILQASNGDAFILGDASIFADGRLILSCANAKVGCHRNIAYADYPRTGRLSRGGRLEIEG